MWDNTCFQGTNFFQAEVEETKLTALHLAVTKRNLNMTQVLLAAGADADARTNRLNTPLHLAAAANAGDIAEYLIAEGADVIDPGNSPLTNRLG